LAADKLLCVSEIQSVFLKFEFGIDINHMKLSDAEPQYVMSDWPPNSLKKAAPRSISCVVPVYNSASTLPSLVAKLWQTLPDLAAQWEIILVNDGSKDQSWETICHLSMQLPNLRGINLMRNYGQQNALLCGIRACSYEITVTLDDDLQNPVEEMEKLLLKIDEGWSVVYGADENRTHSWSRNLLSQLLRLFWQKGLGIKTAQYMSSYRAFRTDIRKAFEDFSNPSVAIDALLARSTQNVCHTFVRQDARLVGKSNYNLSRLIDLALVMTMNLSISPVRLASFSGIFLMVLGFAFLTCLLMGFLAHSGFISGFMLLSALIITSTGMQLTALGIIGEYVAHIYLKTSGFFPYKVKDLIGTKHSIGEQE
jgi:undecaprenyl-phosphate 4-deoxy-4-formamido-L-arabinose transferase